MDSDSNEVVALGEDFWGNLGKTSQAKAVAAAVAAAVEAERQAKTRANSLFALEYLKFSVALPDAKLKGDFGVKTQPHP